MQFGVAAWPDLDIEDTALRLDIACQAKISCETPLALFSDFEDRLSIMRVAGGLRPVGAKPISPVESKMLLAGVDPFLGQTSAGGVYWFVALCSVLRSCRFD